MKGHVCKIPRQIFNYSPPLRPHTPQIRNLGAVIKVFWFKINILSKEHAKPVNNKQIREARYGAEPICVKVRSTPIFWLNINLKPNPGGGGDAFNNRS